MASNEVHELAVAIRPEGADETQAALEDTSAQFEQTADDVGESTSMLSDFANQFTGAGIIFAGAFGTMIGAVASKMPIVSEAFTALEAVLTALGLRFDRLTRDRAQPMIKRMFALADAIATPGEELEALSITLGIVLEGLKKTPAAIPFIALAKLADHFVDVRSGLQAIHRFITTVKPFQILGDAVRNALSGIATFITNLGADIERAVIQHIINPLIARINDLIRTINRIPGMNAPLVGRLEVPVDPRTGSARTAEPPGPRRQTGVRDRGPMPASGGQVVVTGTLDSETNLDSETVATETKPFTVRGVLNGGRGARLR